MKSPCRPRRSLDRAEHSRAHTSCPYYSNSRSLHAAYGLWSVVHPSYSLTTIAQFAPFAEHYSQIQPSTLPIRSIDTEQQQPDHTMVDPTPTSPFTSTTTSNGPYNPVPLSSALLASAMSSVDGFNPHAPVFTPAAENIGNSDLVPTSPSPEIDPQILEALRSKDRIYVLKLGEQMESLISERRCVHSSGATNTRRDFPAPRTLITDFIA